MKKIMDFFENKVAPFLLKVADLKYLNILQRTFVPLIGPIVVGSIFLLFAQLPIPAWQNLIGDFSEVIGKASGLGTSIIAVLVVASASIATVQYYNTNKKEDLDLVGAVIISLASFFLITPPTVVETITDSGTGQFKGISMGNLGATAVFTAIIVSIVTVEIFRFFVNRGYVIKMPEGVPPGVTKAFASLLPGAAVALFWWIIRFVIGIDIGQLVQSLFTPLIQVGDTPGAVLSTTFLNRLLWSIGLHGGNIVGSIADPLWETMNIANMDAFIANAPLPYTYSKIFIGSYIWTGFAPVAAIMCFSKSKRIKTLGMLALPAALFNIGEPITFGLPIVMNPLMIIPQIVGYLLVAILAIISVNLGLIPIPVMSMPWITPAPLKALLATNGDFRALIFVLITWLIIGLIFYPFLKMMEKEDLKQEQEAAMNENLELGHD